MQDRVAACVDGTIDVQKRLADLCQWSAAWQQEDRMLLERLRSLNPKKALDVQIGSQLTIVRRRLRMQLVKEPLEIAPEVIRAVGYGQLRQRLVEQFVRLTKEERERWLQNFLFIMTPDLRHLLEKVTQVRTYRSLGQQRNFLLGGQSGMGKTTFLDWFTYHAHPQLEQERTYIPVVKIDAPVSNHTPKPLFQRLIQECGMQYVKSDNEEDLLMKISLYFQQCGVEVVIVDEVEHITKPDIRRRLLEVSNRSAGIPIICASCEPLRWISGDPEVAGRWNDFYCLEQYTGKRLQQLLAFMNLLLPFPGDSFLNLQQQKRTPRNERQPTHEVGAAIERWTGGIFRDIMMLIIGASQLALDENLSCLDLQVLQRAWQRIQTKQVTDFLELLHRSPER